MWTMSRCLVYGSVAVIFLLSWTVPIVVAAMDFKTALQIVRSQSVIMDIKEHEEPGTNRLVNDPMDTKQMVAMATSHSEAMEVALRGIEELSRTLTGSDKYRRADGLGNNVEHPRWGAALHPQARMLPNKYSDGAGLPRVHSESGGPLPSARTVSLRCFSPSREEGEFFDRNTSQLFFQVGQFIDHDLIATSLEVAFGCCSKTDRDPLTSESPCFPIQIEPGDRTFNESCMNFRRAYGLIVDGVREQVNTATSFLDASTVYGSSEAELTELRQFRGGLLRVTKDNMLPMGHQFPCVRRRIQQCPLSGDSRVSEIAGLTALHTIYHREHNRLAKRLGEVNPHWNDERLFQEARKINIAQLQNIVYYEFLHKLIGRQVMRIMGIDKPYRYDPHINPSILNEFGVAAFRFGHTLLSSKQYFQDGVSHALSELFFRPEHVLYHGEGTLKAVILNQARRFSHKFDSFFTAEIIDKLYLGVDSEAEPGESFDLLARNVQRGRDHGIPSYPDYLDYCLGRLGDLDVISHLALPTCLKTGVYKSVRDLEIFPGGIHETPLADGIVGPTFACIIGEQFHRIKFGDRFFFETPDRKRGFTPEQLDEIHEKGTLSTLICRNSAVTEMQPRALDSRLSKENLKQPCSTFPDIDFNLWKETP